MGLKNERYFSYLPKTLLVDIDIFIVEKRKSKTVSSKLLLDQKKGKFQGHYRTTIRVQQTDFKRSLTGKKRNSATTILRKVRFLESKIDI